MASGAEVQGQAMLSALAGLTAFDAGDIDELLAVAQGDARAFAGAMLLASKLAAEVDRLGGDSAALRARIYDRASALAYSS